MINETGVFFFPGGGHDHDGENSSLIDVTAYSIFDFEWSTSIGGPDRVRRLDRNYTAFREFIITTVNQSILNPAGIFYQPGSINGGSHIISDSITADQIAADTITANEIAANTITANEIAAGTITGDLLNANVVLVNQAILSNNYVPGVSGWAIDGDGTAEFDATSIRGTLTAGAVYIGANDYWDSSGNFQLGGNTGIYTSGGNVRIGTNVIIEGAVVASAVSTGGVEIYSNGVLAASNFVILANGAFGNNNFDVDASGNLTAINANISGEINANSGSIAGWVISSDTISADSGNIALYQEPGYGSIIAGTGAGTQIILDSDASLHAEFGGIDTDINFKTDTAYVFRISGGGSLARISPYLFSASAGGQFSFLAYNEIYTNGEVGMQTGNVNGIGIAYPGCTTGPGTPNYMGLVWDQPDIRGTVDNVVSAVLGTVSDVRSKTNIINAPEDWALKTLNDLRVVEYNPIDIVNVDNTSLGSKRLGLIAQEVINVFPDLVTSADPSNPDAILSVNYLGLVPHLIQVVKILNNEIQSIKQQIGE